MTDETTKPDAPRPGLRERKKLEKAQLICAAARKLFTTLGYEATTLREVAREADVGFGTVFNYATDKAGLLAMVYVDELQRLPRLFKAPSARRSLVNELADAFLTLYDFWAQNAALARIVLPQMEFYGSNPHTDRILARRELVKAELAAWLDDCRARGRVAEGVDTAQAAATLFAIYTSALREWITSEALDRDEGRKRLAWLLALPLAAIEKPKG
ncbi:TetR/AcrR family transcriptional regulator [Derxia gummosa]|uniref:TetR/AcrR family transcriptional regulator n=1 Tax=Derxia gummosa DSM 723 TaxID=1121388 RepID=A0A8B6XBA0_9BURK|nr:helix-turn-helix domain-containing protein [Derxia gummosa]